MNFHTINATVLTKFYFFLSHENKYQIFNVPNNKISMKKMTLQILVTSKHIFSSKIKKSATIVPTMF